MASPPAAFGSDGWFASVVRSNSWKPVGADVTVPQGVYLFAMQLRAESFTDSDPFFIAAATDAVPAATLDNLALPWVNARVDSLIPAEGDWDGDGDIDVADALAGQRLGAPLDGWRAGFGTGAAPLLGTVAVPEPAAIVSTLLGLTLIGGRRTR